MTTTSDVKNPSETTTSDPQSLPVADRIHDIARRADSVPKFIKASIFSIMDGFQVFGAMYRIEIEDRVLWDSSFSSEESTGRWKRVTEAAMLDAANERRPHARHVQSKDGARGLLLSIPVGGDGSMKAGAIAMVMRQGTVEEDRSRLTELQSLVAMMDSYAARMGEPKGQKNQDDDTVMRGVARAASYESLTELAFALTNNLRVRTGSEQVFFGVARGRRIKMISLSGVDDPNLRSSATLMVRQAMEECVDHGGRIIVQSEDDWEGETLSSGHFLHRAWHESTAGAPVASFPMRAGDQVVGVVAMRRPAGEQLSKEEVARIEQLIEPLGMGTLLQERASRDLGTHGKDTASAFLNWVTRGKATGPRIAFFAVCLLMLWGAFGSMSHEVSAKARLSPAQQLTYASPFDGVLREVHVRTGDRVDVGTLLATFDTSDLELEAIRLRKEHQIQLFEAERLQSEDKDAEALVARERANVHLVELKEIEASIQRGEVRAREAGIVMEGDVLLRRGEPLPQGELLFRVAPERKVRLEIDVPETDVDDVREEMVVRFATKARPEETIAAHVTRIRPQAEVREQKNVFVVEADLDLEDQPSWLRPGMEGVGLVEAGSRPVWWLATNRMLDWLRLEVWL